MHINMKYYVVSIGAIFISLGIGILVGFNINDDQVLSDQQSQVIKDLDTKFDELKVTNDNLEKTLQTLNGKYEKSIDYINKNVDLLVSEKLVDKNIGIISTNEKNNYTTEIQSILTKAGGNIAFDIVINNNVFNDEKIKELSEKLQKEMKTSKEVVTYIVDSLNDIENKQKLEELEKMELIKVNYLSENYNNYDEVVLAGGSNGKLGMEPFENIDLNLMNKFKEMEIVVVGVQNSDSKVPYVDSYFKEKISTVDNINEGVGKLSLVTLLQDTNILGQFGRLESSESLIPYKK